MDFKVIFGETFLQDFEDLIKSIAEKDPAAAARIGDKIITKAESTPKLTRSRYCAAGMDEENTTQILEHS